MSCNACCATNLDVPLLSDFDYGTLVYPTQGFSFVIDCPPGYYCPPGVFPVTVTIPKGIIPPVQVPPGITNTGGPVVLRSCSGYITGIITPGIGGVALEAIIAHMQEQWAQNQANCNVVSGLTPLPAGVPILVGNDEECFTTDSSSCPPTEVQQAPITICIPPDTLTQTLLNPTPAQLAAVKAVLNSEALIEATDQAKAGQVCGWYNAGNSYSNSCPCSPGCGAHGPYGWTWSGGIFFSQTSQADANARAFCAACDQLYALCLADGCPAGSCLSARNACGPNPCPS